MLSGNILKYSNSMKQIEGCYTKSNQSKYNTRHEKKKTPLMSLVTIWEDLQIDLSFSVYTRSYIISENK